MGALIEATKSITTQVDEITKSVDNLTTGTLGQHKDMYLSVMKGKFGDSDKPGVFNVVENYPWTFTPPINRIKVPFIQLIEYEQDNSALYAQLAYWGKGIAGISSDDNNPYNNLYHAKPTGTYFIFPYFEASHTRVNPSWNVKGGVLDFAGAEQLTKVVTGAIQVLNLSPGVMINQPKVWDGTQAFTYTVTFTLFNTYPTPSDISQNMKLLLRLRMSTAHSQQNVILALPPAIFEVYIPGIRYSPASAITQLEITNLGQMNQMVIDGKGVNVPDAYQVSVTISELITESREIISASMGGNIGTFGKVRAISREEIPQPESK
jgi:hypothetical protein